jgi:hypothetical protein
MSLGCMFVFLLRRIQEIWVEKYPAVGNSKDWHMVQHGKPAKKTQYVVGLQLLRHAANEMHLAIVVIAWLSTS